MHFEIQPTCSKHCSNYPRTKTLVYKHIYIKTSGTLPSYGSYSLIVTFSDFLSNLRKNTTKSGNAPKKNSGKVATYGGFGDLWKEVV